MVTQSEKTYVLDTASFPIIESFTGQKPNHKWKLDGSAKLAGGCLQLTGDVKDAAGTALLEESFSSAYGVSIEFDYSVQGSDSSLFGDGFCVYLIDGAATTQHGGYGAGLGYASMHDGTVSENGVTQGYVGIGFDDWGNYATQIAGTGGSSNRQPDTVGIRGSGNLKDNFHWLTGAQVAGGFKHSWADLAHVQITIVDRCITVRTSKDNQSGTTIIDKYDLKNASGQAALPKTFKLGLSAGTGGSHSSHELKNLKVALPVDIPLDMQGPADAKSGQQVEYTVKVHNNGPNDCQDAQIEGTFPGHVTGMKVTCSVEGHATYGKAVINGRNFSQPVSLPKPEGTQSSSVTVTLQCTIDAAYTGPLTCASLVNAGSHSNTAAQQTGSVPTTVSEVVIKPPAITEPSDNAQVTDQLQPIKGTVTDADKVTLSEDGKDLGTAHLTGTTWTYTPAQKWSEEQHTVQATAHKNNKTSQPVTVTFTVVDLNLTVSQTFRTCWQKVYNKPEYIYSLELTINAKKQGIEKWTLSFGVEKGVRVDPDWAKTFNIATIVKDGSDGTVVLQNTDPKHRVDPGKPLPIDIQLLCPGKNALYETVHSPTAHEDM